MPRFSLANWLSRRKRRSWKRYLWTGLLVVTLLLSVQFQTTATERMRHYTELEFPPLPEIQLPDYTRFQLKNGMKVFLMPDRELPLIGGTAIFTTGSRLEPADKVGLASIVGEVMRTGGTRTHSPGELNELLEKRAAAIETSIRTTAGVASFNALSEDTDLVLGLFAEVLREPIFDERQLQLAKNQRRGGIARRNDDPSDIASREFQKLVYGPASPYARTIEYATIDNITREDVVNFWAKYFHPNNMILGIVGDFDTPAMRQLIEQKFGDWPANQQLEIPSLPEVEQANKGGIFMVDRPQLSQSNVLMGHLGGKFKDPDYFALDVMNGVLNGLAGRLFNQVRSAQGLAYSVYGFWNPRYDYPGKFIAGGQTRSEATVPFIQAVRSEIEKIGKTPISPAELKSAQDAVLNSFVFNFATPSQTLSRLMQYEYYGYPEDFIFQYRKGVEGTTVADIQRVAQTHLQPDDIVTLVVGNASAIQPPLSSLDAETIVRKIDIK